MSLYKGVYSHLHFYKCSWCRSTATSPVYDPGRPPKCAACLRFMARIYSEPIETAEQMALVDRGIVFNPYAQHDGPIKRWCDECKELYIRDQGINLGVGGKYCSAHCADLGTERHRAEMEQVTANVEALYRERPWLRPTVSAEHKE